MTNMTKWNYNTVICSQKKLDETLKLYGDDGWELTTSVYQSGTHNLIFKRPAVDFHTDSE